MGFGSTSGEPGVNDNELGTPLYGIGDVSVCGGVVLRRIAGDHHDVV
jgi:hypothetical protein